MDKIIASSLRMDTSTIKDIQSKRVKLNDNAIHSVPKEDSDFQADSDENEEDNII